jgi:hypothetical protein
MKLHRCSISKINFTQFYFSRGAPTRGSCDGLLCTSDYDPLI